MSAPARRLGRALSWPVRRFFDPRFAGVDAHVGLAHEALSRQLAEAQRPAEPAVTPESLERALAPLRDELVALREALEGARDVQAALLREQLDLTADATAVLGQSIAELRAELDELARVPERPAAQPADGA